MVYNDKNIFHYFKNSFGVGEIPMTFVQKVIIAVTVPIVFYALQSIQIVSGAWSESQVASIMAENIKVFNAAAACASSLQKERGLTSIAINKAVGWPAVDQQQKISDEKCNAAVNFLKTSHLDHVVVEKTQKSLLDLDGIRKTARGTTHGGVVFSRYTDIITEVLKIESVTANAPTTRGIGKVLTTLTTLDLARENMAQLRGFMSGLLARNGPISDEEFTKLITIKSFIDANLQSPSLILSKKGREQIDLILKSDNKLKIDRTFALVIVKSKQGSYDIDANAFFDLVTKQLEAMQEVLNIEFAAISSKIEVIKQETTLSLLLTIVAAAAVILIAGLVSFYVVKSLNHVIYEITNLVSAVSMGDFSIRTKAHSDDEFGSLLKKINSMADNLANTAHLMSEVGKGNLGVKIELLSAKDQLGSSLQNMVKEITALIDKVRNSSVIVVQHANEISATTQSLASGASTQAAATQQISSTVTELTRNIAVSSEQAELANQCANQAMSSAQTGSEMVSKVVKSMVDINDATKKISDIIKMIDSIAFQTNLLALNASVEAARAGQHGKGFAVVAEEVRNLAGRSANAAKEIAGIVTITQEKVGIGVNIVHSSEEAFASIVEKTASASDIMDRIYKDIRQQSLAVAQVAHGLGQITEVTLRNTATSEETSSAIMTLKGLAEDLNAALSYFKYYAN
jgi:methyl-accepting chemotaxis protein